VRPTARDLDAQRLADERGHLGITPVEGVAELEPEMAVRVALAWHLARTEAHVEGSLQPLRPAYVGEEWARGTQPSAYPSLVVLGRTVRQRDTILAVPYEVDGQDVISLDNAWALWRVGEDTGEGVVHVHASHAPQRDALANAVADALSGDLDRLQGIGLPLPEATLPRVFRGLLATARFPRARVALASAPIPVDDGAAAAGGVWRADVVFTWQAPRLAARRRLPDLAAEVVVSFAAPSEA
jgi:hypothetical protein